MVVKGQISSRESKNLSVYLFCYEDDNQELGTVELFKRSPTQECKRSLCLLEYSVALDIIRKVTFEI